MTKVQKHKQKIEIDFTDAQITGSGGLHFVSRIALRLGLPALLQKRILQTLLWLHIVLSAMEQAGNSVVREVPVPARAFLSVSF